MRNDTRATPGQAFALLVDADNTSADLFPQIMHKVEAWGTITIRRVYGNQETLLGQKWKELCLHYALQPILHLGISGAKNATDIALTVDAMDLLWLYKETLTSFCLVTGDQDFTALVLRLRNQGCKVYCIGKPSKAEALAKVCTEFLSVEHMSVPVAPLQQTAPAQATVKAQKKAQPTKTETKKSHLDPVLTQLLTQAAEKIMEDKHVEWVSLPHLGSCLKQLNTKFQAKTYGYKSLPELIKSRTDLFESRPQGKHLEVRLKERKIG